MNLSLRKEATSVTVPYCEATIDEPPSFIPRLDCKGKRARADRVLCSPKTTTRLAGAFLAKAGCLVKLPLLGLLSRCSPWGLLQHVSSHCNWTRTNKEVQLPDIFVNGVGVGFWKDPAVCQPQILCSSLPFCCCNQHLGQNQLEKWLVSSCSPSLMEVRGGGNLWRDTTYWLPPCFCSDGTCSEVAALAKALGGTELPPLITSY